MQVEGHDGVRVMTVHAAKGLEFPVVAVADLGRALGGRLSSPRCRHRPARRARSGDPAGARFGMRLPIAAGDSLRLWELVELCEEEQRAEVEESLPPRLRGRQPRAGAADPERRRPPLEARAGPGGVAVGAPRSSCCSAPSWSAGWSGDDAEVALRARAGGRRERRQRAAAQARGADPGARAPSGRPSFGAGGRRRIRDRRCRRPPTDAGARRAGPPRDRRPPVLLGPGRLRRLRLSLLRRARARARLAFAADRR